MAGASTDRQVYHQPLGAPTTTGEWRQITDFGERATFIVRRVSWSSDGRSILAAVGEGDSDIVLLEGLTNVGASEFLAENAIA